MGKQEAYQEKAEARLREWKADIDKLMAQAEQAKAQGKIEYYKRAETFNAKYQAALRKSEELKGAADDKWAELKAVVEASVAELKAALSNGLGKL